MTSSYFSPLIRQFSLICLTIALIPFPLPIKLLPKAYGHVPAQRTSSFYTHHLKKSFFYKKNQSFT